MKKLSELKDDDFIMIGDSNFATVISKKNYLLNKKNFANSTYLYNTRNENKTMTLYHMLKDFEPYFQEDWLDNMTRELEGNLVIAEAIDIINKCFKKYPIYKEAEKIIDDSVN